MDKKFPKLNFKTKNVGFVILIALLIVNVAIILTLFEGNTTDDKNVTFTITDVDCIPIHKHYEYTLSTHITLDDYPSNLKGYYLKQTFYDKNGVICDKLYNLDSLVIQDVFTNSVQLEIKVYKQPYPDHVSIEIIKDGEVINNSTCKFNKYQMRN